VFDFTLIAAESQPFGMRYHLDLMSLNLIDIFETGGWAMYPLAALSVVSVALSIERALFWLGLRRTNGRGGFVKLLTKARSTPPRELAATLGKRPGFYRRFARDLCSRLDGASPTETRLNAIAQELIERDRTAIERFSVTLSTIITAAPMIGILGTVTGIIRSFELLGDGGGVTDPTAVAGGVAEALLTTAFGLMVALLTLFPFVWSKGQGDRCLGRLEAVVAAVAAGGEDSVSQMSDP